MEQCGMNPRIHYVETAVNLVSKISRRMTQSKSFEKVGKCDVAHQPISYWAKLKIVWKNHKMKKCLQLRVLKF